MSQKDDIKSTEVRAAAVLTASPVATDDVLNKNLNSIDFFVNLSTQGSVTLLTFGQQYSPVAEGDDWYDAQDEAAGVFTDLARTRAIAGAKKFVFKVPARGLRTRITIQADDGTGSVCSISVLKRDD